MEKLKTNELSLGLNQTFRSDLVDNFEKIQKGVDGQSDALNKQITDLLGDVAPQDQNEVTQARIDGNGKLYDTLKGRADATQATAETALSEERSTSVEVQDARTNSSSQTYPTLKERMDSQESDLNNSINDKLAQISAVPETFANLAALQSKYPTGKTGIFVTADTGHKYIWANGSWQDAGVYQGIAITDDQMLLLSQNVFNQDNLLINGFFSTQDSVLPWGKSSISLKKILNKRWVNAFSSNIEKYNGVSFDFKEDTLAAWKTESFNIFIIEFDVLSAFDCTLNIDLVYIDKDSKIENLTSFQVVSNSAEHRKIIVVKDPYIDRTPHINLAFSDYAAEAINFSIANLKITGRSYL